METRFKWSYSTISELEKLCEKFGSDIARIAKQMELSKPSVQSAIARYLRPNTILYKRRVKK